MLGRNLLENISKLDDRSPIVLPATAATNEDYQGQFQSDLRQLIASKQPNGIYIFWDKLTESDVNVEDWRALFIFLQECKAPFLCFWPNTLFSISNSNFQKLEQAINLVTRNKEVSFSIDTTLLKPKEMEMHTLGLPMSVSPMPASPISVSSMSISPAPSSTSSASSSTPASPTPTAPAALKKKRHRMFYLFIEHHLNVPYTIGRSPRNIRPPSPLAVYSVSRQINRMKQTKSEPAMAINADEINAATSTRVNTNN